MSEEQIEIIMNYISTLAPVITAVVSMVISVVIALKKYGSLSKSSVDKINALTEEILRDNAETREETKAIKNQVRALQIENESLKKELKAKQRTKIHGENK